MSDDEANARLNEVLSESIREGLDWSLLTGLDWTHYELYLKIRFETSKKYPKPKELMEDEEDTINIAEARHDENAPVFLRALDLIHNGLERARVLQHLATEYEKKCVRWYCFLTNNWNRDEVPKDFRKGWRDVDIYETVECYFRILRKYGLYTKEEPYYFLSPQKRRDVKITGDMLKRSTQFDENEIYISILGDLL